MSKDPKQQYGSKVHVIEIPREEKSFKLDEFKENLPHPSPEQRHGELKLLKYKITNEDFLEPKSYKNLLLDFEVFKKIEKIFFVSIFSISFDDLKKIELLMRKMLRIQCLHFVNVSLQNNQLMIIKDYLSNNPLRLKTLQFTANNLTGFQLKTLFLSDSTLSKMINLENLIISDNWSLGLRTDLVKQLFTCFAQICRERDEKKRPKLGFTFQNNSCEEILSHLGEIFSDSAAAINEKYNQKPSRAQIHVDLTLNDLSTKTLKNLSKLFKATEILYDEFSFQIQSIDLSRNTNAGIKAWEEFSGFLEITKHLKKLTLRECDLSEGEMEFISSALGKNKSLPLMELDISDNSELFSNGMSGWTRLYDDYLRSWRDLGADSLGCLKLLKMKYIELNVAKMLELSANLSQLRLERLVYFEREEDMDSLSEEAFVKFEENYLKSKNARAFLKGLKLKRLNRYSNEPENAENKSPTEKRQNFSSLNSKTKTLVLQSKPNKYQSLLETILEGIKQLDNLECLDISVTYVGDVTWGSLFHAVGNLKKLKVLKLKENKLPDDEALLNALENSVVSLEFFSVINLSGNNSLNSNLSKFIVRLIARRPSLRQVFISRCGLSRESLTRIFSENYPTESSIELIDISKNTNFSQAESKVNSSEEINDLKALADFRKSIQNFITARKSRTKVVISANQKLPVDPNSGLKGLLIDESEFRAKKNSSELTIMDLPTFYEKFNAELVSIKQKSEGKEMSDLEKLFLTDNDENKIDLTKALEKAAVEDPRGRETSNNDVLKESTVKQADAFAPPRSRPNSAIKFERVRSDTKLEILPSYIHKILRSFTINKTNVLPKYAFASEKASSQVNSSSSEKEILSKGFASTILFLWKCQNLKQVCYQPAAIPEQSLNILKATLTHVERKEIKGDPECDWLKEAFDENFYEDSEVVDVKKFKEFSPNAFSVRGEEMKPFIIKLPNAIKSGDQFKSLRNVIAGRRLFLLDLRNNPVIDSMQWIEFFLYLIKKDTTVQDMSLSGNQSFDEALEKVSGGDSTSPLLQQSELCKLMLQRVDFSLIKFGEGSWKNLCDGFLAHNAFLISLNVSVTECQLEDLTIALRKNRNISIEKLTISCYDYSSPEGWLAIGYGILRSSRTLREIVLDHCDISQKLKQLFSKCFLIPNLSDFQEQYEGYLSMLSNSEVDLNEFEAEPQERLVHEQDVLMKTLSDLSSTAYAGLYFSTCGLSILNLLVCKTPLSEIPSEVDMFMRVTKLDLKKSFQRVEYRAFQRFIINLAKFERLEEINLSDNNLTYFFAQVLLHTIPKIKHLKSVDLSYNFLSIDCNRLQRELTHNFNFQKSLIKLYKIKSELTLFHLCQSDVFKYRRPNFFDFSDLLINSLTLTDLLFEDIVDFLTGPCLSPRSLEFFVKEQKDLANLKGLNEADVSGLKFVDFSGNNLSMPDVLSILEKFKKIFDADDGCPLFQLQKIYFLRNSLLEDFLHGQEGVKFLEKVFEDFNQTPIDEIYFDYTYNHYEFKHTEEKFIQFIRLLPPAEIDLEKNHVSKVMPFLSLNAMRALYSMMFEWPHIKYVTIYYDYKAFINQGIAFSLRERLYKRKWTSSLAILVKKILYKILGFFIVSQQKFRFNEQSLRLNDYLEKQFRYVGILVIMLIPIYYFCGIFGPIYFRNHCHAPIPLISVIIYVIFAAVTGLIEIFLYCKIKSVLKKEAKKNKAVKTLTKMQKFKQFLGEASKILTSQLARYDLYTDVCFVIICYLCEEYVISLLSLIVLSLNFIIRFFKLLATIQRNYFARKKRLLRTGNIAGLVYLCSFVEFVALGDVLEEISPYNVWTIPGWRCFGTLQNQTIDSDLFDHFLQFLFEDFPQFLLQIAYLTRGKITPIIIFNLVITILNSCNAIYKFLSKVPSYVSQIQIDSLIKRKSGGPQQFLKNDGKGVDVKNLGVKNLDVKTLDVKTLDVKTLDVKTLDVKNLFLKSNKAQPLQSIQTFKISNSELFKAGQQSQERTKRGLAVSLEDSEKLLLEDNSKSHEIVKESWKKKDK